MENELDKRKEELRKRLSEKLATAVLQDDERFMSLLDYMIKIGDFYTGNTDEDEGHYERVKKEYERYGEFGRGIIDWLWEELIETYSPDVIEPIQLSFDEQLEKTKRLPAVIIPGDQSQILNEIIPERLSRKEFKVGPVEETEKHYVLTYTKDDTEIETTYTFLCRKEQSKLKDGRVEGIPTFGKLAKQAYFLPHAIALVTKNVSPKFRPSDVLKFGDYYSPEELAEAGNVYRNLKNVYRTLAYVTYEKIDKKTGETITIGHILDRVDFDPKNKTFQVTLPSKTEELYNRYWRGEKGIRFIKYQLPVIKSRKLDKYDINLDNWLAHIRGAGERTYPISVRTLLIKKMGYSKEKVRVRGSKWAWKVMREKIDKAQRRGTLKEYDLMQDKNCRQYGLDNLIKWQIRLVAG